MNGTAREYNLAQPVAACSSNSGVIHSQRQVGPYRTKVCVKCKIRLPLEKFSHRKSKDNRLAVCVSCWPTLRNVPNPIIRCGQCLYELGFGYHRIAKQIFGSYSKNRKRRIATWKKTHHWKSTVDQGKCYYAILRSKRPAPKPKPVRDLIYLKNHKRRRVYLRRKVWVFLKHAQHLKSTAELIGCNRSQFLAYLTPLLQPGMTFQNYGPIWHIDHKIPCRFFDLSKPDQRSLCFHYTNLQPMFAHENKVKWATLPSVDTLHGNLTTLKALALSAQREFSFQ